MSTKEFSSHKSAHETNGSNAAINNPAFCPEFYKELSPAFSIENQIRRWHLAMTALLLLRSDPLHLRGVLVKCSHGPVHQAFLTTLQKQFRMAHLPVGISVERLQGGIDINQTLVRGRPVYQTGLLDSDHDALLLNGAERLPTTTSSILSAWLEQDRRKPPVLIAMDETADDHSAMAQQSLGERLALMIELPDLPVAALQVLLDEDPDDNQVSALSARPAQTQEHAELKQAADISQASQVAVPETILRELTVLAQQMDIASLRPLVFATRVARLHAWLTGKASVQREDATVAVQLVLAPRAQCLPGKDQDTDEEETSPAQESSPEEHTHDSSAQNEPPDSSTTVQDPDDKQAGELTEQLLAAAEATLPAHLLAQLAGTQQRSGGSGRDANSGAHGHKFGRPVGVRRPRGGLDGQRLNLLETIKCAVPRQRLRAGTAENAQSRNTLQSRSGPELSYESSYESSFESSHDSNHQPSHKSKYDSSYESDRNSGNSADGRTRLRIRTEDFRVTRYKQPTRRTTVFLVDASGSAALHRLAEAKGAIELLLAECYVRRDRVAMISFRGQGATLDLPPTQSLVRAKRELAGLPGGGGTPLASGLELALTLVRQLEQAGETPVLIVMSDGKANVARNGEASRPQAMQESHEICKQIAITGIKSLFIDTSPRARVPAAELARSMQARYLPLPPGGARALPPLMAATQ